MNRNPTGASGKEPLGEGERAQLTAIAGTKGFDVELSFPELSEFAFARALLGKPVNRSTRELIRLGLERLATEKNSLTVAEARARQSDPYHPDPDINAEVVADRDEGRAVDASAGIREGWHRGWKPGGAAQPVCPRCLDIEPGTPGGTPEEPHPGPFTEGPSPAVSDLRGLAARESQPARNIRDAQATDELEARAKEAAGAGPRL